MPNNGDAVELEKLKKLLLKEEIERIKNIEHRLNDAGAEADSVSKVIAEAIIMRSVKDNMLSKALEPILENSLKQDMRKRPHDYVNILFPLIGPTIRRSVSETFNSMLANLSKGLETSFSIKGLKWRLEAIRSGKSFSEIVALHTLIYSVDQAFLIHSETGLLLSNVQREGITSKDADLVSGMLTAIQDFAKDCFNNEGDNSTLNSLKMDDYTIYIEQSPSVYIACVVRGTPPPNLPSKFREAIELVLAEYRDALMDFNGDTAPFHGAEKYLYDLLGAKFIDDDKVLSRKVKAIPAVLLALLVTFFGLKTYNSYRMEKGLELIRSHPGIVLIDVRKNWGLAPWRVTLLHDILAPTPEQILRDNGHREGLLNIRSIPFTSYEPSIIMKRVLSKIKLPPHVNVSFSGNTLKFDGVAGMDWIMDARQIALMTPGVSSVDISELADPRYEELQAKVDWIESAHIRFPLGKSMPIPEDVKILENIMDELASLEKLAESMGLKVTLTVYGHADSVGSDKANYEISQERAKTFAYMLYARGSHIPVSIYGMGANYADDLKENLNSRKIEMKVNIMPGASGVIFNNNEVM